MNRKDYLETWGYLQALKDIYEEKARSAVARGDYTGDKLARDYVRMAADITAMQHKINTESETRGERDPA